MWVRRSESSMWQNDNVPLLVLWRTLWSQIEQRLTHTRGNQRARTCGEKKKKLFCADRRSEFQFYDASLKLADRPFPTIIPCWSEHKSPTSALVEFISVRRQRRAVHSERKIFLSISHCNTVWVLVNDRSSHWFSWNFTGQSDRSCFVLTGHGSILVGHMSDDRPQ